MTGQGQNPRPFTRNSRPSAEKAEHRMKTAGKSICFDQKPELQRSTIYISSQTAKNHTAAGKSICNRQAVTGKKPHRNT